METVTVWQRFSVNLHVTEKSSRLCLGIFFYLTSDMGRKAGEKS